MLAYSLAEALWLVRHGHPDVLVGYPTVDLGALTELGQDPGWRRRSRRWLTPWLTWT